MAQTFFVTSLGLRASGYDLVDYALAGQTHRTRFAPAATAKLLNLSGATALILVTEDVHKRLEFKELSNELGEVGLQPEPMPISPKDNPEELGRLLNQLASRIPERSQLTLDVTFGLRHLPFFYFAALTFLHGLKGVHIKGVYYGAYELGKEGTAPILSIGHIFELIEWFQALRAFRDSGDAAAVARSLKSNVAELFRRRAGDLALSKSKDDVLQLAEALWLGLPLEGGMAAARLTDDIQRLTFCPTAPAAYLVVEALRSTIEPWKLSAASAKATLPLSKNELRRQIAFCKWLVDRGDLGSALRLIRELLVNLTLFALGSDTGWLDRNPGRVNAERHLNAMAERARSHLPSADSEKQMASLWDSVRPDRNYVAHAGMTPHEAHLSPEQLHRWLSDCGLLLDNPPPLSRPTSSGTVLISPLGKSSGVLFSALKTTSPSHVILISSQEALEKLEEIKCEAGYPHVEVHKRVLLDPHAGFTEIAAKSDPELDSLLIDASEVVVNITGGTTALQWAVERIAERANRLGATVKHIALVDRRPLTEQQANPYVVGQRIDLESFEAKADPD
jgi:hypothetical protein